MLQILQFIFSSFWIWLGTLILMTAPLAYLCELARTLFRKNE